MKTPLGPPGPIPLQEALESRPRPWPTRVALDLAVSLCEQLEAIRQASPELLPDRLEPRRLILHPEGRLELTLPTHAAPPDPERSSRLMREVTRLVERMTDPEALDGTFLWARARSIAGDGLGYRSFAELGEALRGAHPDLHAGLQAPPRPRPPAPAPPPRPRKAGSWALAAALLGLGLSGVGVILWGRPEGAAGPLLRGPGLAAASGSRIRFMTSDQGGAIAALDLREEIGGLAASPDGRWLVASLPGSARLAFVDPWEGRIAGHVPLDRDPRELVIEPEGEWLFAAHPSQGLISAVQLRDRPSQGRPAPAGPDRLQARPARLLAMEGDPWSLHAAREEGGATLFVAGRDRLTAWRLRAHEQVLTRRLTSPGPLTLSPGGRHLYVTCRGQGAVEVLDPKSLKTLRRLTVDRAEPIWLECAAEGLWALLDRGQLIRIDPPGPARLELGQGQALALAHDPQGRRLWTSQDSPPRILEVRLHPPSVRAVGALTPPPTRLTWIPARSPRP